MLPTTRSQPRIYLVLIVTITLMAAWARFWRLADVPPGLEYDEAINGLDAIWMLETKTAYVFVKSLHGREALFLYPVALFISLFGATPFALRLTSILAGILAIPLLYRLTLTLFRSDPHRYWLAIIAAAGLGGSFWHIAMSRVALRVVLIPPFLILVAYLFWRGWQIHTDGQPKRSYIYYAAAGVALGLSLYTYLAARLLPLVFLLTAIGVWLANKKNRSSTLAVLGPGLLIMGLVSAIILTPMVLFFLENAETLGRRADQVNYQVEWTGQGIIDLTRHIARAFTLFLGGTDPRIRHHLIERPVFDWLTLAAFWIGVGVALRHWRRPAFLFLLLALFILWLPGPLSVDPIHSPRTSGILPAFFVLVAVGLFQSVKWLISKLWFRSGRASHDSSPFLANRVSLWAGWVSLGLTVFVIGGMNSFDYLVRWASHPLVYQEYKGPSIDLAQYTATLSETADVILPYKFYAYPPVRYVLGSHFTEELTLPFSPVDRLSAGRPVIYLDWLEDQPSSLLVWLTRPDSEHAAAYLIPVLAGIDKETGLVQSVQGERGNIIGNSVRLDQALLEQILRQQQIVTTPFTWAEHIRLGGYELASSLVKAGEPGVLTLYWQGLKDTELATHLFIQLLNEQGEPVSQLEEPIIREEINYYENRTGFVFQQHLFWTGPDARPGLYLLRIGLFEPKSGQRLPVATTDKTIGDQVILAPFYVSTGDMDPRLPDNVLSARLGPAIELLGYSLEQPLNRTASGQLKVKLYWQATSQVEKDYTAFVQLLDDQNQILSQWDSQPLAGLYPTSRWQPGQVVTGEFPLSLNGDLPGGTYRLVTGMYEFQTGERLPVFDSDRQPWPDNMIVLTENKIP